MRQRLGGAADARRGAAVRRHPLGPVEPADHRRPVLGEQPRVAVLLVQLPRHQHDRVAPARGAVHLLQEPGALGRPASAPCRRACRPPTARRRGRAATSARSRRRRRGTPRWGRTAASRRSSPPARGSGSRSGCRRRCRGSSTPRPRAAGSSRSSLQANQPRGRRSVCTTTPVTSSAVERSGWPSIRTYWKPCVVSRGSKTSPSTPAETTSSTWPALSGSGRNGMSGPQVLDGHVAVGAERLAVGEGERGAGRAEVGQPHPAVDVLAEVDDLDRRAAAR